MRQVSRQEGPGQESVGTEEAGRQRGPQRRGSRSDSQRDDPPVVPATRGPRARKKGGLATRSGH